MGNGDPRNSRTWTIPHKTRGLWATSLTWETGLFALSLTLIWSGKNKHLIFDEWMVLICKTMSPLHERMLCTKLKLARWFWRIFFLFRQSIFAISKLSPLGKGRVHLIEYTWIPITQGNFVTSLVAIDLVVLEKKIFKFCQFIFAISIRNHLRLEGAWHFIWTNLNPDHKWILWAMFGWNCFLKFCQCFYCFFVSISLWKRTWPFIWSNCNSLYLRMCQVWLKLAQWFLRRDEHAKRLRQQRSRRQQRRTMGKLWSKKLT